MDVGSRNKTIPIVLRLVICRGQLAYVVLPLVGAIYYALVVGKASLLQALVVTALGLVRLEVVALILILVVVACATLVRRILLPHLCCGPADHNNKVEACNHDQANGKGTLAQQTRLFFRFGRLLCDVLKQSCQPVK